MPINPGLLVYSFSPGSDVIRAGITTNAQWRIGLTPLRWVEVPASNILSDVDPANDPTINPNDEDSAPWRGIGGQPYAILAWNSACYDPETGWLYVGPAGGHGDYGGNERYRVNLLATTPVWQLLGKPSGSIGLPPVDFGESGSATGIYSDGWPRSPHTYGYSVFVPGVGPMLVRICAPFPGMDDVKKAFAIDSKTGDFTLFKDYTAQSNAGGSTSSGSADYDSLRHCLWILHAGTAQLTKLDIATKAVSGHGIFENLVAGGNGPRLIYARSIDKLLSLSVSAPGYADGGQGFMALEPTTGAITPLTYTGDFASGFVFQGGESVTGGGIGAFWDDVRGRLVMWNNSTNTGELSTLTPTGDPLTAPWVAGSIQLDAGNVVLPSAKTNAGTFGRFFLGQDGAFLLNGVSQPIYFLPFS